MSKPTIRNQKAKLAADYNELLKELCSPKIKSIGCYTIGETIGKGSYGKVKLGVHKLTCRLVAIKKINKKHAPLMAREIHHHRQLTHPNIVLLYEILSTEQSIFIVSEHCPHGDLLEALTRQGRFSEYQSKIWFAQLIDAVHYCHQLGIIHRDLKLENILLDEFDQLKICDFGFARQTDKNQLLKTFCGSLAYSAPEVIQRQSYSGPATDIWSLGVILYTLLAGELPFDDDCEVILQKKIVALDYSIPAYFSLEATDLVQKILKLNPNERLSSINIKCHKWLKDVNDKVTMTTPLESTEKQEKITQHLLNAGFETSVIREMSSDQTGMLSTIWKMLIKKSERKRDEGWMNSFKSWFISKPPMLKTVLAPPIITTSPLMEDLNSSTCSSTADDDSSIHSSPATSHDEEEFEPLSKPTHDFMNAFHRISPMPSRADILIPRSRYTIEDRQLNLRNRLENKIIIEEDEEEA